MHIKEIMSQPPVTCPVDYTLDVAARLMWEFDCGVIPIVDADGRLTGVVTDRDICMAALSQGKPLHELPIARTMSPHPVACHVDDSVESVEQLMRDAQIRRVPVVDVDRRPIGVVALNDLVRLAAHARKSGVDREFVETMAAVCRPRARAVPISKAASRPPVVA